MANPAEDALATAGIRYRLISHGPVRSLAEAAQARGVTPADVVKTMVVRRGPDDFLFVLVPGDRSISWPKLRAHLGVSRLSLPDAATAQQATGYQRGTITPFGSVRSWPVLTGSEQAGLGDARALAIPDEPLGAERDPELVVRHGQEERLLADLAGVRPHRAALVVQVRCDVHRSGDH